MFTKSDLEKALSDAIKTAEDLGWDYEKLSDSELEILTNTLNKQFILYYPQREFQSLYANHLNDILLGAIVAKAQMHAEIQGEMPGSNQIGVTVPRAAYFGIGDDWEDASPFTTGSEQNWIHSGTTLLGGTAGNPIKVGENAVHVILGIATRHPSPKIESFKPYINGNPQPILSVGYQWRVAGVPIKDLERAWVLRKDSQLKVTLFISAAFGASAEDYPYLVGVSYIKEPQLKLIDAADVPGTVQNVVLTT